VPGTPPVTGTVNWEYNTSGISWVVNNSYEVQASSSNPGLLQPTAAVLPFKMENLTPVSGWAWSQNIGWISFSGENDHNAAVPGVQPSPIKYGSFINKDTFAFSGYAWSNIGWITFNRSLTGGPPSAPAYPNHLAQYSPIAEEFFGWMRAISVCASFPCAPGNSEGWDGWIRLNRDIAPPPTLDEPGVDYLVDYDKITEEFRGWAWGSKVVDWISFNCDTDPGCDPLTEDHFVTANLSAPPVAWDLAQTPNYVDLENFEISPPFHRFTWQFFDAEDGSVLTRYRLQIYRDSTFSLASYDPLWDADISFGPGALTSPFDTFRDVQVTTASLTSFDIRYNTTYYWRIEVFDAGGQGSGWTYPPSPFQASPDKVGPGTSFTTALHIYPTADFNFFPAEPSEGEEITFVQNATCYDISNSVISCPATAGNYKWDFDYIGGVFTVPYDATGPIVAHTYDTVGTDCLGGPGYCVAFEITDQDGLTTRVEKNISIKKPLPQFRERAPSGFLDKAKKLLAGIWGSLPLTKGEISARGGSAFGGKRGYVVTTSP
jgi:hypothetical protein